tara:strand:- start:8575 stop:8976 length:402 start_codon:yes stop_codon:yes gene_type:complete
MERMIKIDDTLEQRIAGAIEEVHNLLIAYVQEHGIEEGDDPPCLSNDLNYSGSVDEMIESATPFCTAEIRDTMYLHGDAIEEAFENAGIGEKEDSEGFPLGWKAAAINIYISERVGEWYWDEAEGIVEGLIKS